RRRRQILRRRVDVALTFYGQGRSYRSFSSLHPQESSFRPEPLTLFVSGGVEKSASPRPRQTSTRPTQKIALKRCVFLVPAKRVVKTPGLPRNSSQLRHKNTATCTPLFAETPETPSTQAKSLRKISSF